MENVLAWGAAAYEVIIAAMAVVGGSGGIMYWIDRGRSKPRLEIHKCRLSGGSEGPLGVSLEIESLGNEPISLRPHGRFVAHEFLGGVTRGTFTWDHQTHRRLEPRAPTYVAAVLRPSVGPMPRSVRAYKLRVGLTVGRSKVVRGLAVEPHPVGRLRYGAVILQEQLRRLKIRRLFRKQRNQRPGD